MSGYCWPSASSTAWTVPPGTSTTALPAVCCRIGVGMWTLIAIRTPNEELNHRGTETQRRQKKEIFILLISLCLCASVVQFLNQDWLARDDTLEGVERRPDDRRLL